MNKSNPNYDTLSPGSSISIPTYSSGSSTSCLSGNSSLSSSPQQDSHAMPSQPIYILNQPMSNSSSSPSDSLSSLIMKQNAEDMQLSQAYSQSCMNPSEDYLDSSLSDDLDSNQTSGHLNTSANLNSGRANRFFPDSVVDILNRWFNENQEYPYPDDNMTNILAKEANISAKQVRKWFANKRVRSNKCFKQTCRTKKERRQTKSISDADMFHVHAYSKLSSDNEEESDDMVGQVNFDLTNLNFKKSKMSKRAPITKCKSTNFNASSPMPQYQCHGGFEPSQMMSNELSDQVNDNLDQHQQFYSDFGGHQHHQQQQQLKSSLQRSASVQSAQELINLYNLSLWKNALLENSNNNKTSLENGHYGSMHCSQSFANQQSLAQQQQQQQMQTTSSVTSAVVAAAALYNPYLLVNLFQNPIAFQAALTNRLLNLDNKSSGASSQQQQQQGNSFNESNGNNMELSPSSAQHCYTGQSGGCGKMKTSRSSKTCLHKRRNSSLIKLQQGKCLRNLGIFF
jgi:hypothetical protein